MNVGLITIFGLLILSICGIPIFLSLGIATLAAMSLGGMPLVDCILEQSHTCYEGTRRERHPWGYGCGRCPACKLRAHGYEVYLSRYHQK